MPNQFSLSYLARKTAKEKGEKTYHGSPCKNCRSIIKYTNSSGCHRCHNERNKHKLYDGTVDKYHTPGKTRNRLTNWRKNNPQKVADQRKRVLEYQAAYQSGRRAKVKKQTSIDANNDVILSIYEEARRLTKITGIPHEVDHKIPIVRGGLHHQDNLQILTRKENRQKGSKLCG
jgi:5-methylcytosine-specific restriction endonuclease McrA